MEFHFRSQRDQRRRRGRNFQKHERRRELEETNGRPSGADWSSRSCRGDEQAKCRDGGRAKLRRRLRNAKRSPKQEWRRVPIGGWRRTLEADERDRPAPV